MHIHVTLWLNFRGHPENVSFMKFLKIWMVSDKMIHKAFRTHVTPLNIKNLKSKVHAAILSKILNKKLRFITTCRTLGKMG